jgi:enoyl-CoA hydratase / 3-hydroxyacyl-CoA dehydrogenase
LKLKRKVGVKVATLKVSNSLNIPEMTRIQKITVLGSGIMGHGIAQVSAMAGFEVTLRDIKHEFLDNAMTKIKWSLDKLVEKESISKSASDSIYNRIHPVVPLKEALDGADLLIEAVPESIDLKRAVYNEVDQHSDKKTIYASNTSTLPISEISTLTNRPKNFIGIHFFNPPQLMKLVEVIPGTYTNEDTINIALDFVKKLGKQPILCRKDIPGFIVNRIFIPLVHEATYCIDREAPTMRQLDSAVKFKLSFPMGIFELADYTGIDVIHKATIEMYARDKTVLLPHPKIKELFDKGNFGKKSGIGFYSYGEDHYERVLLSEEEATAYEPSGLLAVALNKASWLISNEVCSLEDLETALKLGMGLRNPLFNTAKQFGSKKIVTTLEELRERYGNFYTIEKNLTSLLQ